jgi:hypothetical protein
MMHIARWSSLLLALVAGAMSSAGNQPPPITNPLAFQAADYINIYPDLMNSYGPDGAKAAVTQWSQVGLPKQGRRASVVFDPQYYLQNNADLRARFGAQGYQAALEHFLTKGLPLEGRRGSLEFDAKYYLAGNADVRASAGPHGYLAAAQHFMAQGLQQGRQGSAEFSVKDYIAMYPDVAAAYGSSDYQQALWHWLRRGQAQGRKGVGTPELSSDCQPAARLKDYTRIFIAQRTDGMAGSGTADDPFDGSTAQKFDALLRSRSEAGQQNLIVCIGPGKFLTEGDADFVINIPHTTARGFTVNKNWKVHGAGMDRTTLQLSEYQANPYGYPLGTASGVVFSTHDDHASGIEISDLTIDDNFPELKPKAARNKILRINLTGIHLRSDEGGNTVRRVHVMNSAGEVIEGFPVWIVSVNPAVRTRNNLVEYVTMHGWGGGKCTAIAVANGVAEVRNNVVKDYQIAYGGWIMGSASFHDNFAINTEYGFNVDSLANDGTLIQFNQIIHPRNYGIVVGGVDSYANFKIENNTFVIKPTVLALLLRGNVTHAHVANNNFIVNSGKGNVDPILLQGKGNAANVYESNHLFRDGRVTDAAVKVE